jgi:uncharacterized damage-inducible protein DinB
MFTETQRLSGLFSDLYNGHPWIDVTLVDTLKNIPAEQAGKRPLANCNTIWEIVRHLIRWRQNVLQRVQGQVIKTPGNNYIEPVQDPSPEAWMALLQELEETQVKWLEFLQQLQIEHLENEYPVNGLTYYEHIQGIIQHDAYHLGQIVLLAKQ